MNTPRLTAEERDTVLALLPKIIAHLDELAADCWRVHESRVMAGAISAHGAIGGLLAEASGGAASVIETAQYWGPKDD